MPSEPPTSPPRISVSLVLVTGAYLLPAIVAAFWTRNGEFIFYSAVIVIQAALVIVANRHCGFSQPVLWGLCLWGLAHMVGGLVPVPESWPINGPIRVVYSWWIIPNRLKYDQVIHAYGFAVMTFVCWQGLAALVRDLQPGRSLRPNFGALLLCIAASTGFGALNEVIEFVATLLVPKTNVGGYVNTGWDLVSNLAGAITAAIWIRQSPRTAAVTAERNQE
jgi:hypothetical protein